MGLMAYDGCLFFIDSTAVGSEAFFAISETLRPKPVDCNVDVPAHKIYHVAFHIAEEGGQRAIALRHGKGDHP